MNTSNTQRDSREFAYELKFFVGSEQQAALKEWARAHLAPDPHGAGPHGDSYRVSSIYFDTRAFHVLGRQGSYARAKYRVRRYDDGDIVYLERKTRGAMRVFKRRSPIVLDRLLRLDAPEAASGWEGHWFHRRLLARSLGAVSRVDYQRIARVGLSDCGPMRLTVDEELQAWPVRGLSFETPAVAGTRIGSAPLILELKFGNAMPALFKQLIREFSPRPQGISKYRLACLALGLGAPSAAAAPLELLPSLAALRAPAVAPCGANGSHSAANGNPHALVNGTINGASNGAAHGASSGASHVAGNGVAHGAATSVRARVT